jgi:hypothetical protein
MDFRTLPNKLRTLCSLACLSWWLLTDLSKWKINNKQTNNQRKKETSKQLSEQTKTSKDKHFGIY